MNTNSNQTYASVYKTDSVETAPWNVTLRMEDNEVIYFEEQGRKVLISTA